MGNDYRAVLWNARPYSLMQMEKSPSDLFGVDIMDIWWFNPAILERYPNSQDQKGLPSYPTKLALER